jgi:hypothetical protein
VPSQDVLHHVQIDVPVGEHVSMGPGQWSQDDNRDGEYSRLYEWQEASGNCPIGVDLGELEFEFKRFR